MADRYGLSGKTGTAVVRISLLTDGGNDWPDDEGRIAAALKRLTENSHVFVAVIGVAPDSSKNVEKELGGVSPDQRLILNAGQEKDAMEQFWNRSK